MQYKVIRKASSHTYTGGLERVKNTPCNEINQSINQYQSIFV